MVTAGLKWPPLTWPKAMISKKSAKAWASPTTAKSEPVCELGLVET